MVNLCLSGDRYAFLTVAPSGFSISSLSWNGCPMHRISACIASVPMLSFAAVYALRLSGSGGLREIG